MARRRKEWPGGGRDAWESGEQYPAHPQCAPQQIPASLAARSIAALGGDAGTVWSVLLLSLAGGGLGVVAGAAGRPQVALPVLAGSAGKLSWKSRECVSLLGKE